MSPHVFKIFKNINIGNNITILSQIPQEGADETSPQRSREMDSTETVI